MNNKKLLTFVLLLSAVAQACAVSSHQVTSSSLGETTTLDSVEVDLDTPGPIEFERIVAANWAVDRSGLVNMDHPEAAHLEDELENIELYVYRVTHPEHGTFLIDTGISQDLADDGESDDISGMVASAMNVDKLSVHVTTREIVESSPGPIQGVFLTHMHLDHIFGMPDIQDDVPVYTGPGEADHSAFLHMFVQGTTDNLLEGKGGLREWSFREEQSVVDVFEDGSLFAVHTPGHSPGSVAFVIRSTRGPVLITGDTCHTGFGWENTVEPGSFTADQELNRESLEMLRALAAAHPTMEVHLGHQQVGQKLTAYQTK